MKRTLPVVLLVLAWLGLVAGAWAAGDTGGSQNVARTAVAVGYTPSTASGNYRDAVSAGDNADLDNVAVATVQSLSVGGKTEVSVMGLFSNSAATALIEVVRYRGTEVRGYSSQTLTAVTTAPTIGGRYPSQTFYFETQNADFVKVLFRGNPSAGSVVLKVDSY